MEYVSVGISALSALIVLVTFFKNSKKDVVQETNETNSIKESLLKANIKLDQVCATTNETRSDIKAMNAKIADLDIEMEIVKRDLKTAFEKIDEIRSKIY